MQRSPSQQGDESLTVEGLVSFSDTVAAGRAAHTLTVACVAVIIVPSQLTCFLLLPTLCKQLNDI